MELQESNNQLELQLKNQIQNLQNAETPWHLHWFIDIHVCV